MEIRKLSYRTVLYVPTEYGNNEDIPLEKINKMMEKTLMELVEIGGGATVIDGVGYWQSNLENRTGTMKTKLIMCYIDDLEKGVKVLKELALWIKNQSSSEAVCFEINNHLYIL